MIQVLGKHLGVAVAARGDVEVALNPVQVQRAVDATAVGLDAVPETGRLAEAARLAAHGDDVVDVGLAEALVVPADAGVDAALAVAAEPVKPLAIDPIPPGGGVLLQTRGGEDAVPGGILHVDVEVLADHVHDDVEVDLHAVSDALLDAEGVVLAALPPPRQLGPEEEGRDDDDDDGPLAAARRAGYVLGFCLCCSGGDQMENTLAYARLLRISVFILTEGIEGAHEAAGGGLVIEVTLLVVAVHRGSFGVLLVCQFIYITQSPPPSPRRGGSSEIYLCGLCPGRARHRPRTYVSGDRGIDLQNTKETGQWQDIALFRISEQHRAVARVYTVGLGGKYVYTRELQNNEDSFHPASIRYVTYFGREVCTLFYPCPRYIELG